MSSDSRRSGDSSMEGAMSFTVEVPGGTNPLSLQGLAETLESATTSLVYAQRRAAEQQLQTWETYPGYWSSLQVRNAFPITHCP